MRARTHQARTLEPFGNIDWLTVNKQRRYLAISVGFVVLYVGAAVWLAANKDFGDQGPLSFRESELKEPLPGGMKILAAKQRCLPDPLEGDTVKLVGATIEGEPYYACYEIDEYGDVYEANVIGAEDGLAVKDVAFLKRSGAWPWLGVVKKESELIAGGFALAAILWVPFVYYRRLRPGQPTYPVKWWQRHGVLVALGVVLPLVGWGAVAAIRGVTRSQKQKVVLQSIVVGGGVWMSFPWMFFTDYPELWGAVVLSLLTGAYIFAVAAGRSWIKPEGFGLPEDVLTGKTPVETYVEGRGMGLQSPAMPPVTPSSAPVTGSQAAPPGNPFRRKPPSSQFKVEKPTMLPNFNRVGGMNVLKGELKETFGLMLAFAGEAERYRITWNGLLLHGPPGVGKTFIAKAVAGEYGLNFIQVSTGDLVSSYSGESARNVQAAFREASQNVPCILFFDEFDSIAQSRDDWPDRESRRTVNQLLQSLEEWRKIRELIVVAATNSLEQLDQAVIRPGRFDRHIRIDLPDGEARKAIFTALLEDRPAVKDLDLAELSRRSEGLTPAAISQAVEAAAISAFREATESGEMVEITMEHLIRGLDSRGGRDRPTVEEWTWEKLVLPDGLKRELMQLQLLVEDPERARAFGVEPPTGVLLTGPPGTGKTTIAKVLAAQAKCSFYPVSSATITSKWLGESERNIQRLFHRARENRPSIIFIDEIDAVASARGEWGSYDKEVNQLLTEIDGMGGQRGVLVIAATNRPDQLDPALLRGGRLSRVIEIPLPDASARKTLLSLYSDKMPLVGVDLSVLASESEGMSAADIKALCQQAALLAMMRGDTSPHVSQEDFRTAISGERREDQLKKQERGYI